MQSSGSDLGHVLELAASLEPIMSVRAGSTTVETRVRFSAFRVFLSAKRHLGDIDVDSGLGQSTSLRIASVIKEKCNGTN